MWGCDCPAQRVTARCSASTAYRCTQTSPASQAYCSASAPRADPLSYVGLLRVYDKSQQNFRLSWCFSVLKVRLRVERTSRKGVPVRHRTSDYVCLLCQPRHMQTYPSIHTLCRQHVEKRHLGSRYGFLVSSRFCAWHTQYICLYNNIYNVMM